MVFFNCTAYANPTRFNSRSGASDRVSKAEWKRISTRIRRTLQKGDVMCHSQLSKDYIFLQLENSTDVVLVMDEESIKRNGRVQRSVRGFAMCQFVTHNFTPGLRITIICAKSNGGVFIKKVDEYALRTGCTYVELEAVNNVINFYRKYGYRHITSCDQEETPALHLTAEVQSTKKFENKEVLNSDKDYVNFMRDLTDSGFSVSCRPDHQKISEDTFYNNMCDANGFRMKKCLTNQTSKHPKGARATKMLSKRNPKGAPASHLTNRTKMLSKRNPKVAEHLRKQRLQNKHPPRTVPPRRAPPTPIPGPFANCPEMQVEAEALCPRWHSAQAEIDNCIMDASASCMGRLKK